MATPAKVMLGSGPMTLQSDRSSVPSTRRHGARRLKRHRPDQATPSSLGPAGILQSASHVVISGGTFTNAHPGQTSITISVDNHGNEIGKPFNRIPQVQSQEQQPNLEHIQEYAPRMSNLDMPPYRPQSELDSDQPPRKSSVEIYQNHLGKPLVRGRPLWIPQPNSQLPKEYREKGVLIGDVGIFTPEGGFDFLFNILHPSSDPINPRKVPENFSPLSPPLEYFDIRKFREFGEDSHLSSPAVSKVQGGTFTESGAIFESSAPEGAILLMPEGASVEELSNISIFRDYIKENAESFYDYANNKCGREISNGQLHVVYGSRKSSSWGIATFCNTSADSNLRLQFLPAPEGIQSGPIQWQHRLHSGNADIKVGPHAEDNEDLSISENGHKHKNQCLFANTLGIRLSDSVWKRRHPKKAVEIHEESDTEKESQTSTICSLNPSNSSQFDEGNTASNTGSSHNPKNRKRRALNSDSMSEYTCSSEDVILEKSSSPLAPAYYSEVLTEYLLKSPNATMAISGDRDWNGQLPLNDAAAVIENACSLNDICEKDGVVFFEPKECNPTDEEITSITNALQTGNFDLHQYLFGHNNLQKKELSDLSHPYRILSLDKIMHYSG